MSTSKNSDPHRTGFPHRLSMSSVASSGYTQKMHPRTHSHSHSLSVGSINPVHRVSRRKSMSSSLANKDAVMAALNNSAEAGSFSARRAGKPGSGSKQPPPFPASLPNASGFPANYDAARSGGSAVTDGPTLASLPENEKGSGKARMRRASEGSRLSKGESKRSSATELRCEKCGKGYKHSSCLSKHLWEHTPEWQYTSKLLISKHQQVQLLEAASVLVAMNQEASSAVESDNSSSPAASGSSDPHEDDLMSSAETTPPPPPHDYASASGQRSATRSDFGQASKRFSANSSAFSQSYQSSVFSESAPSGSRPYMSHYRQWSTDGRPTTSGTSVSGSYKETSESKEHADLAAAVGLLSCSFGTPKSGPIMLPADVPPVPPLPAQFLGQKADALSGSTMTMTAPSQEYSYLRERKPNIDVDMDDDDDDLERQRATRGRSDEDDEGMFGKMEE